MKPYPLIQSHHSTLKVARGVCHKEKIRCALLQKKTNKINSEGDQPVNFSTLFENSLPNTSESLAPRSRPPPSCKGTKKESVRRAW